MAVLANEPIPPLRIPPFGAVNGVIGVLDCIDEIFSAVCGGGEFGVDASPGFGDAVFEMTESVMDGGGGVVARDSRFAVWHFERRSAVSDMRWSGEDGFEPC